MLLALVTSGYVPLHMILLCSTSGGNATSLPCRDEVFRLFSCQTSPLPARHNAWISYLPFSGRPTGDPRMKGVLHYLSSAQLVRDTSVIKASYYVQKCAHSPASKHVLQARGPSEAHSNDFHLLFLLCC